MHYSAESLADFAHTLVAWYRVNARKLPWRETTDPYRILVSETMLQQTRVETVIPYYHRFVEAYPNAVALADAAEDDVMKLWEGLGYYRRARNLHRAMQVVRDAYGGEIPDDAEAVRALPGVGPYTAGAVMSIAFNRPQPAVDGNVLRVMARFLSITHPVDLPATKRTITDAVDLAIHTEEPRLLTQALMELGALVCVPRRPRCEMCPVASACLGRQQGTAPELPLKTAKKARRKVTVVALWIERDGALLAERRADDGLLAGMWQLPMVELPDDPPYSRDQLYLAARTRLHKLAFGNTIEEDVSSVAEKPAAVDFVIAAEARHVFTHLEWRVVVVRPVGYHQVHIATQSDNAMWVPRGELSKLVWPKVYQTLLSQLLHGLLVL
ncbi:adenine DNA glycosylase [Alicyclobacillus hesperidum]|uniref:Adenine DNA glycosylase n=1 Tax=Alicyclobacillus hesperidum TaxID=89784 RepID=A0AA37TXS9_9BACL|nr:A/G-specific adenine glycosylase [Alicyclobacillus hesperidum]GLV14545.1 adenine DNA glycosylase [Alicyclobacillus hesperidum]